MKKILTWMMLTAFFCIMLSNTQNSAQKEQIGIASFYA